MNSVGLLFEELDRIMRARFRGILLRLYRVGVRKLCMQRKACVIVADHQLDLMCRY